MNQDIAAGKWKQLVGQAKQYWGELTDDDIRKAEGGAEKLQGVLQEKYGRTREEAKKQVDDFISKHH